MGSAVKAEKRLKKASQKASLKNNPKSLSPKPHNTKFKKPKKKTKNANNHPETTENSKSKPQPASASEQLSFFLNQFESANGVRVSSLELESIKESCILELSSSLEQDAETLAKHVREAFGTSWKEALCEGQLSEGKVDPGCPAVLIISTSALRSIELLRGLRSLTKECHAVKLFSKHMKVEEQWLQSIMSPVEEEYKYYLYNVNAISMSMNAVDMLTRLGNDAKIQRSKVSLLKNRVNFASGTPSRIKKLIDIEALGLSRLAVIVLDMQVDVKGYSLFTLPQVRDEFWDLYKNYFHQRLLQGDLRICLYGQIPNDNGFKGKAIINS